MKMKDAFDLPVYYKGGFEIFENNPWNETIRISEEMLKPEECANAVVHAINNHDKLTEENARLREALTSISNMCIGEIAMGYKIDAQCIGELIYKATGKTNPELNQLLKGDEDE